MPGPRAFERDLAAWYETLGNGEGMYGLAAIVSPQKICAALHPKQGAILEGTVYEAVAPRIPAAGLMSFEGMVAKGRDWRTINVSPEERALDDVGG